MDNAPSATVKINMQLIVLISSFAANFKEIQNMLNRITCLFASLKSTTDDGKYIVNSVILLMKNAYDYSLTCALSEYPPFWG